MAGRGQQLRDGDAVRSPRTFVRCPVVRVACTLIPCFERQTDSARNSETLSLVGFRACQIGGTEDWSGNRQRLIKAIDTHLMASC